MDIQERLNDPAGEARPSLETKDNQLVTMEMTETELGEWQERIKAAQQRLDNHSPEWDILLKDYIPTVSRMGEAEDVKVGTHFRNTHSKLGQLFFAKPDVVLTPEEPSPAQNQLPNPVDPERPLQLEDIIAVKQQVLNKWLGRDGIKISRLQDQRLFDVLQYSGFGACKIGYRCFLPPALPPTENPANPLGITPSALEPVQAPPVHEEWYASYISPKEVLWDAELTSTRHDEDASWIGMRFKLSPKQGMRLLGLSEEEAQKINEYNYKAPHDKDRADRQPHKLNCVEVWFKGSLFLDTIIHPQVMVQLVLVEGLDRPAVYRLSPDQTLLPNGRLSQDSLIGFPIQVLTVRDLTDSSFPRSDAAHAQSAIKQESTWMRQSIQLRDAAIGKYLADADAFDEMDKKRLEEGPVGAIIWTKPGQLQQGSEKILATTAQVKATADDYRNRQLLKQDIKETIGIGANQAGVAEDKVLSATEIAEVASSGDARSGKERGRVVDDFLDICRKLDTLLMRYATEDRYIEMTGMEGARRMQVWNKQVIAGRWIYDISPDSSLQMDTARDFQMAMQHWNVVAGDPFTNRQYLLQRMARLKGYDPAKAVISKLPESKPEQPKMSFTFKGEDLALPEVRVILIKAGLLPPSAAEPSPEAVEAMLAAQAPPQNKDGENPGTAPKAQTVSQHMASNSGGKENAPGSSNFRAGQPK